MIDWTKPIIRQIESSSYHFLPSRHSDERLRDLFIMRSLRSKNERKICSELVLLALTWSKSKESLIHNCDECVNISSVRCVLLNNIPIIGDTILSSLSFYWCMMYTDTILEMKMNFVLSIIDGKAFMLTSSSANRQKWTSTIFWAIGR